MKQFETPVLEVINFEPADVITTSPVVPSLPGTILPDDDV